MSAPKFDLLPEETAIDTRMPAKGQWINPDSVKKPISVPLHSPTLIKAGLPEVLLPKTNVHPAGIPKEISLDEPRVITPGQDGYLLSSYRALRSHTILLL